MNSLGSKHPNPEWFVRPPTWFEKTDPQSAYVYAKDVLGGRFPEGEAAIAKSSGPAYVYAREVLKGPFPEGEAAIATEPWTANRYAKDVINGRFPEGEAVIATNPVWSTQYLKEFPEAKLEWAINGWLDWTDL